MKQSNPTEPWPWMINPASQSEDRSQIKQEVSHLKSNIINKFRKENWDKKKSRSL